MGIQTKRLFIFMTMLFLLVITACSNNSGSDDTNPYNFPDYVLHAAHPGAQAAYEYAVVEDEGVLDYIPCYCNCFIEPFNHENVRDCFISNTESTDELIVYDDHGAG